jgi:site-specific recombinase XerD
VKYIAEAGITGHPKPFQYLLHTFATFVLESGRNINGLLGH